MSDKYEYYSKFNWSSNPFTLTISPDLMVGYSKESDSLLTHLHNFHKFALILGPTGSGKTTMLMWLRAQLMAYKKFYPYYISKPPKSPKNLIRLFKTILGFNLFDGLRFRNLNLFDLSKFVFKKLNDKHLILLIDEAHESSLSSLEWIRTIADSVSNVSVILAGLPVFEKKLNTHLSTLFMRITTKVYLNTLSEPETEALILKRIESVGGEGLNPFTADAVRRIFEITGGFPREVIKICDKLTRQASIKNIPNINRNFVDQALEVTAMPELLELTISLSKKQKEILDILNEKTNLTPSELADYMDVSDYKDKSSAIRSVNNILRRMLRDEFLQRKKLGNSYVYFLSGKAKTIFTET